MKTLVLVALMAGGCAAKRPVHIEIPRECLVKIEVSDKTVCSGNDQGTMECTNLILTYRKGCERVAVQKR